MLYHLFKPAYVYQHSHVGLLCGHHDPVGLVHAKSQAHA